MIPGRLPNADKAIARIELIAFEGFNPLAFQSDPAGDREEEYTEMASHPDAKLLWLGPRAGSVSVHLSNEQGMASQP